MDFLKSKYFIITYHCIWVGILLTLSSISLDWNILDAALLGLNIAKYPSWVHMSLYLPYTSATLI
jgi:hypothetical protein